MKRNKDLKFSKNLYKEALRAGNAESVANRDMDEAKGTPGYTKAGGKEKITVTLFVGVLLSMFVLNLFFPNRAEISEAENRALATFPEYSSESLFAGDYFRGIEDYYTDHFFQRESIIGFSSAVNEYKGIRGADNVQLITTVDRDEYNDIGKVSDDSDSSASMSHNDELLPEVEVIIERSDLQQEAKQYIVTSQDLNARTRTLAKAEIDYYISLEPVEYVSEVDEEELIRMAVTEEPEVDGYKQNGLLVVNDEAFEIFGYSEASCRFYAGAINGFAEQFDEEITTYSIVVPSHIEFLKSEKYRSLAESQADCINYINEQFSEDVQPVNIYNSLAEHADDYLYFRSDHHWTQRGAYWAYTSFAKKIGDKAYDLDAFEYETVDGFLGTLYNRTKNSTIKANPDTVEIFHPFYDSEFTIYTETGAKIDYYDVINMSWKDTGNKYMVFISGDQPLSIIDSDIDNGRKIMVFKDSYGNALIPFLISHYDEIHIIDPRKYDDGAVSYAKENDITEFLFINSAVVIAGHTGFAQNIYKVTY